MKKYERKINYKHDFFSVHNFRCPEKFSLQKIQEYANQDNLKFNNEDLQEIQTLTYTICEVLYSNWVRVKKQKLTFENNNNQNEESNNLYQSEYRRAS